MRIKIYGHGWVGKAMTRLFPGSIVVDPKYTHYESSRDKEADVAFICVPTPLHPSKQFLDCSEVGDVVRSAPEELIVIRSTVQPMVCQRLAMEAKKRIVYQPEYLGETTDHPLADMAGRGFMVLGGEPEDRRKVIELYQQVYNANIKIRQMSLLEAEIVKLSENRAILWKLMQCSELYDLCEKAGVDYYSIRDAVYSDDPRFNLWWTFIYPDKRGAQSKCIPKDVIAWCAYAESIGIKVPATRMLLDYNASLVAMREAVTHALHQP